MSGKRAEETVLSRDPDFSPRDALRWAAIDVVELARTSAVTLAAIAEAAEVDADVASGLYPTVDDLLVDAALQMCARELRLSTVVETDGAPPVSSYAHHFARRRAFYRAMRIGPVAHQLDARMAELVAPLIAAQIRTLVGARMTPRALDAMIAEVTAESFEVTTGWILESGEGDGAESLYVRLEAIVLRRLDEVRGLG
jgi:hypothetical protein